MKRRILLFALALVTGTLLSPVATAKPVSMHDARRAVAVFLHVGEPLGISPVAASSSPLTCYFEGLNLRVENPGGETLRLYDIPGRCLSISNATHSSFSVPAPGVYILRAGTRPALKVVAVKQ